MKIQKGILHISASNMREPLGLNDIVFVKDANYEMNSTNLGIKTVFADIQEQTGSRALELSAVAYQKVYKIYCRYDALITLNSTFTYKGNLLKIHSINNLSQLNRYFEILAYTDV